MSPQKKGKSSTAAKRSEPSTLDQPSACKTSNGLAENEQGTAPMEGEQGVAEGTTEEVQPDAQMGAATLESLEAREDFKRQLEAIMDATKVPLMPYKPQQ